jgi:hypothetical protein
LIYSKLRVKINIETYSGVRLSKDIMSTQTPSPEEIKIDEQAVEQVQTEETKIQKDVEQEVNVEQAPEKAEVADEEKSAPAATPAAAPAAEASTPAPVQAKSQEVLDIENILSDGLDDLYSKLPDNRKAEFKQKGEEAASQISLVLKQAKVKVGKVVDLIKGWLSMIPGVNKFFLDQESKIKADKLLDYKNNQEG